MKINYSFLLALIVITASAFTVKNFIDTPETEVVVKNWTSVEKAVDYAQTDQKKILIDVYTDWCKWCKVMDEKTFSDSDVSAFLGKNFHLAKFNAEQKETIKFNGKEYNYIKNGKRGYHEFATEILNDRLSYPSLVVLDSKLNKLEVIRGFKNPQELMNILSDE